MAAGFFGNSMGYSAAHTGILRCSRCGPKSYNYAPYSATRSTFLKCRVMHTLPFVTGHFCGFFFLLKASKMSYRRRLKTADVFRELARDSDSNIEPSDIDESPDFLPGEAVSKVKPPINQVQVLADKV